MATRRAAVLVAVLLAAAGCAGTGGPTPAVPSVTPAPVPTDAPPTPAFRLAPGLSESGVVSPLALVSAHAAVLRENPYRVRLAERVERLDGTPIEGRLVEATVVSESVYRLRVVRTRGNATDVERERYADGRALYERLVTDGRPRYYRPRASFDDRGPVPEVLRGRPTQRDALYVAFIGSRPRYAGPETVDGVRGHRVVATTASRPGFVASWEYVDEVSSYEFAALVSPDGLVRSYELTFVATARDERVRVVRTARWSDVGNATAAAPDWYETAREQVGA